MPLNGRFRSEKNGLIQSVACCCCLSSADTSLALPSLEFSARFGTELLQLLLIRGACALPAGHVIAV